MVGVQRLKKCGFHQHIGTGIETHSLQNIQVYNREKEIPGFIELEILQIAGGRGEGGGQHGGLAEAPGRGHQL